MKNFVILLLLFSVYSSFLQAKEVDVSLLIKNPNMLYTCDYVKQSARKLLKTLGARNLKLSCSGGYPISSSNRLKLHFDIASIEDLDADWEFVSWRSKRGDSCFLELYILEETMHHVEVADMNLKKNCHFSRGYYSIDLIIYSYIAPL